MTIKFIGCRVFNTAMAAYRDTLSGYYQVSFSNQRDLVETQFLLDYFRSNRSQIKVWKNATNEERVKNFSPGVLRKLLDKRDGFIDKKREARYKQFCEYASHVSYPGMKLLANQDQLIEFGPFYDESKLLNTMHELCLNFGYDVISLRTNLKITDVSAPAIKAEIQLMEDFYKMYKLGNVETPQFQKTKENINNLLDQLRTLQSDHQRFSLRGAK